MNVQVLPFKFAFKPFGTPQKRAVIKGELSCSSVLWRSKPDGIDVELLAWGLRNPYDLAFSEDGELYISDNFLEEKGERAVHALFRVIGQSPNTVSDPITVQIAVNMEKALFIPRFNRRRSWIMETSYIVCSISTNKRWEPCSCGTIRIITGHEGNRRPCLPDCS